MKIHQHNAGHITKMAAMPILMKLCMKHQRPKPFTIILCKLIPCADLDLFNGKFCNLGFYMGKCDNDGFFGNYCIL